MYGNILVFTESNSCITNWKKREGKRMDEAIHALGEAYVAFVRKHPGLYEATFYEMKK